jgi:dihydropteroate synthase
MFTLNCNGNLLVADKPLVMGIINITPDSFYEGSRFSGMETILQQAEKMLKDGATIIDLGAQSTRPGSKVLGAEEELSRLTGAVELVHRNFPGAIISVDTYYARVAEASIVAGAGMINDISGGNADPAMLSTVGSFRVPYVCMHINGTPATMHQRTEYNDITKEVLDYFIAKIDLCRTAGIHDVIIDPGFGFSKRSAQNFELLKHLLVLKMLGKPVLSGVSRKSTIYRTLGIAAADALNGTTVMNTISLLNGADILRVHDVKQAVEAIRLVAAYEGFI